MTAAAKRQALRAALRRRELVVAPGVFEMVSAKVADRIGFQALYMTGYGVSASHLGLPDAGLASYADVLERVRVIAAGTRAPLLCDADTGFGGLLNVRHTVQGFENAGAAAVQLEDQQMPKKCGFTPGRRVVDAEEMRRKIEVAAEARQDPDLVIIARTDARTDLGLEEALRRARLYGAAGADVIFIQAPESVAELERIAAEVEQPLLVNMGRGGARLPLSTEELGRLGFSIAIYPNLGLLAAAQALDTAYGELKRSGSTVQPAYSPDAMHRLMGFEDVWAFEKRWYPPDAE